MVKSKLLSVLFIASSLLLTTSFWKVKASEDSPTLEVLAQFPGYVYDVDIEGNYAYVAKWEDLEIYDLSDPANIHLVGSYHEEGCRFKAVDAVGSRSYVVQSIRDCGFENDLYVLDVSNPADPRLVHEEPIDASIVSINSEVIYSEGRVYITENRGGLSIVDVSDESNPVVYPDYNPTPGYGYDDLDVVGNYVYLAMGTGGFIVVDASDLGNLSLAGEHDLPTGPIARYHSNGIIVRDDLVYLATSIPGLRIFRMNGVASSTEIGVVSSPGYARDIELSGNYAFVADSWEGLSIFDVSDPTNPNLILNDDSLGYIERLKVQGNIIVTAGLSRSGFQVLRVNGLDIGKQLDVPMFKQSVLPWGGQEYDHADSQSLWCGNTVGQCGCVVSSIAMILKYYGVDQAPNGALTTPESVNEYFRQGLECGILGCASKGYKFGNIVWPAVGEYTADSNVIYGTQKIIFSGLGSYDASIVGNEINNDRPIVLRVPGSEHWVVAKGISGDTFNINDPGYDRFALNDPAYGNTGIAMRQYKKTASDYSSFEVTSLAPAQILVTDSQGQRTGFDPETLSVVEEIPNSHYYFEESYSDPTGQSAPPPEGAGIYTVLIMTPEQDDYEVEIIAPENELYSFVLYETNKNADTELLLFEDEIESGENHTYSFQYDPLQEEVKIVRNVPIDIKPGSDPNSINCENEKVVIPVTILSTDSFDATTVDHLSVNFEGVAEMHIDKETGEPRRHEEDVDGDGDIDLVFHFRFKDAGLSCTLSEAEVVGSTLGGTSIKGSDTIVLH